MQLILLPGMDGTGRLFADFIDAMDLRVAPKVIAYPGDRALSYGELTDLVRRALPIDEPYVLLAESFSGPIAIAIAAEELPGLVALILVSSFARAPIRLPRILRAIVAWMPMRWAPVALVSRVILGRSATPIAQSTLCEALASVSASAWRARIADVLNVNVIDRVPAIRVPSLYLRASNDTLVPREASDLIATRTPNLRTVDIVSSHFILQSNPREAARVIHEFLDEAHIGA